jgi:hypothetical protein
LLRFARALDLHFVVGNIEGIQFRQEVSLDLFLIGILIYIKSFSLLIIIMTRTITVAVTDFNSEFLLSFFDTD